MLSVEETENLGVSKFLLSSAVLCIREPLLTSSIKLQTRLLFAPYVCFIFFSQTSSLLPKELYEKRLYLRACGLFFLDLSDQAPEASGLKFCRNNFRNFFAFMVILWRKLFEKSQFYFVTTSSLKTTFILPRGLPLSCSANSCCFLEPPVFLLLIEFCSFSC